MAKTRAQLNRGLRQEELREYLAKQKLVQQIIGDARKIGELPHDETSAFEMQKLKTASELRMKLVNKYLPDLKAVESTVEVDGVVDHEITVRVIN